MMEIQLQVAETQVLEFKLQFIKIFCWIASLDH